MINEDEYLERVVAGIQAATSHNAQVTWNAILNGRQFDVAVRFELASLRYLVLFEVKNRKRKTSAEDLDAFVTKSRDQNANKAVFVNVAGYQSGAIEVARRHGLELFTVKIDVARPDFSPSMSGIVIENPDALPGLPSLTISEPEQILQIVDIELVFADGESYRMPDETTQVGYYMNRTTFDDGSPLANAMEPFGYAKVGEGEEIAQSIAIEPARRITPPDDIYFPAGGLAKIRCRIKLTKSRRLSGNILIEPTTLRAPVIYTNAVTGEASEFTLDQLPLGNEKVEPGRFYMQVQPLMYYHCDGVEDDLVTWSLIESFQNGNMARATFTQRIRYAVHFIPVRDKKTVSRLERRLADYRALQTKRS